MEISNAIAALSAVFAAASALYARHTIAVSRKANDISIHNERLKIYKALLEYHAHLAARGISTTEKELWGFYKASQLAEFYYPKEYAVGFEEIFDESLKLFSLKDSWETERESRSPEDYKQLVRDTHSLHRATRDKCSSLADSLKPFLRIGDQ